MIVTNSTSFLPSSVGSRKSWISLYPGTCLPAISGKISVLSRASYLSAFSGFVHPRQILPIIPLAPPLVYRWLVVTVGAIRAEFSPIGACGGPRDRIGGCATDRLLKCAHGCRNVERDPTARLYPPPRPSVRIG